jgi:hypothetical protein
MVMITVMINNTCFKKKVVRMKIHHLLKINQPTMKTIKKRSRRSLKLAVSTSQKEPKLTMLSWMVLEVSVLSQSIVITLC